MKFHISTEDKLLVGALAVMGFLFSSREWLMWLNTLTPISGLVVYYIVLFFSLLILSKAGLIINQVKISNPKQVFGLLMVTFAFFIVVGFSSAYTQWVTNSNIDISPVFVQCEDGSVFYAWSQVIPPVAANMEMLRILTYVVSPVLIGFIGVGLVKGRIEIG